MVRRVACTLILLFVGVSALSGVPNAPTNLTAQVIGTTVTLTWSAPAGPVLGYVLEGGSSSGLSNLARAVVPATTSFVAAGIPAGTYFVRVRAIDASGESAPSNEIVVTVSGPCATPPNAPVNLRSTVTGQAVNLTWTPGGGCAPSGFVLLAGSGPGLSNLAVANVGLATSVSAAAPPGNYYVRAHAQNSFGVSGPSNEILVQIAAPPNYTGVWTLTRTGSYSWITQYRVLTVALVQNGTALSGWILPQGRTTPTPLAAHLGVLPDGRAFFGNESIYNYWNDYSDAYFTMTLNASQNQMTGMCNSDFTCTSASAVRIQ
jgi:hypothetical protein